MKVKRKCVYCFGRVVGKMRICFDCKKKRKTLQMRCAKIVMVAMREGRLPHLIDENSECADCGDRASVYDHRDYRMPLNVVPVCDSCNLRRGPAAFSDGHEHFLTRTSGRTKITWSDMRKTTQRA